MPGIDSIQPQHPATTAGQLAPAPIWVGGNSRKAAERAARFGQGCGASSEGCRAGAHDGERAG
jgi:alkanesulfonate monooxygenase SsuD/methylene tetrahydromethanopterin reductase-like flavin-dependent oxidoreductase (luciferase family)